MQWLTDSWATVTLPQATIVSGILTLAAAAFGVLLGWWLFSGKVKDLKSAIDESDNLIRDHRLRTEETLQGVWDSLSSTMEILGQLRGSIGDLEAATSEELENAGQAATRDALRDNWHSIRDSLERLAAYPEIDGRTRAKYGRIDRRRYRDLVNSLTADGALDHGTAQNYLEAVAIWHQYRNGRRDPSPEHAQRMEELAQVLCIEP
ncbi:hypothetical protein [Thalassobaculum sp.]|uniref:hypothetical protein n=1 Tax=Thalassobaculum sp. TaxID=2022740 RepID=UPI0032F0128D